MAQIGNIEILFIAGFGPIVRDTAASRKLYNQTLGIDFTEETGGYLSSYRGPERREQFRAVAACTGGAVLFRQRPLARRYSAAASLARV